ncbi:sensor histidine kinase [Marinactinospora thermotolerans]|uniref:sensor histidine kinase n=1 Tax=Marinactinospora thermotolerans TaxID=531310 RepID=UPI003D8B046D
MTGENRTGARTARRTAPAPGSGLRAAGRGLLLFSSFLLGVVLLVFLLCSIALIPVGIGLFTTPWAIAAIRSHTGLRRDLAERWSGLRIPAPYQAEPGFGSGAAGRIRQVAWTLGDRATWRDALWLLTAPVVGGVVTLLPAALLLAPVWGVVYQFVWPSLAMAGGGTWFLFVPVGNQVHALVALPLTLWTIPVLARYGSALVDADARFAALLLGPDQRARLGHRVDLLQRTREDAVDTSAAELRRIERDLHDGAQARFVAVGMTLDTAEQLLDHDVQAARAMLKEARAASGKALSELRDLVRGIHPPILADRGLGDAVRTIALESPLRVEVDVDLPDARPPAPVEAAVYFGICEALANAAKHSEARGVWIDVGHADGVLRAVVTDDGRGGADPGRGGGIEGITRRLATFDGILALTSPEGGPTVVTMEVPCALS